MIDSQQNFWEHFADLRKHLVYIVVVFVVMLIASMVFVTRIYNYLVHPLTELHYKLIVVSPGEVVMVYLAIGGLVAIGLTLPFALWQLWRFVRPGLTPTERRYTVRLLPVMVVMFLIGVCFSWFVIFPTILHFLVQLSAQHFQVLFRAGAYFSFLTGICLPFGFVFELPIVVIFLTRIGVITPRFLRKSRRFAYLVIVILGVFISPPELISHLSVITPMIALYEVSILLSGMAKRSRDRNMAKEEETNKNTSPIG